MNENIKTFSLVVITVCVFIITVIEILNMMQQRSARLQAQGTTIQATPGYTEIPSALLQEAQNGKQAPPPDMPLAAIKFDEMEHDFGDMVKGDVVHYSFKFKNIGTNPLVISNAHGSCGCTIPSYPKEPIPPGGESSIEVQFNSTGKEGLQNKNVMVVANTDPQQTVLTIKANVNKPE